jgi:hypothetical protein
MTEVRDRGTAGCQDKADRAKADRAKADRSDGLKRAEWGLVFLPTALAFGVVPGHANVQAGEQSLCEKRDRVRFVA